MIDEDLFRKLKPVYGERIDKLWKAYLLEDSEGREEIERILNHLYLKAFSDKVDNHKVLFVPPPKEVLDGEYPVGKVIYNDKEYGTFCLREDEWIQHLAIFGRSGAGKTTLAYTLIANLLLHNKPFVILDWKKNYRNLVKLSNKYEILVYTVGKNVSPFYFNPLIPPLGTEPSSWIKKINEIICKAMYVGEGVSYLLLRALDYLYKKFGVYSGKAQSYPNMQDVFEYMKNQQVKGREANWMASTLRSLSSLCFGEMGKVINVRRQADLGELLNKNVILELDSLTSTDKVFLIESLLLWIHHYRLNQNDRERFKHCIVIEEAHHILRKPAPGAKESITELLLREIRELGESVILLDQHPSLISLQALGNTYTTFTFNLKAKADVNSAANYLLLNDEENNYLGQLEVGYAVVKQQGRWFKPFLLKVPYVAIKNVFVSDKEIKAHMLRYSTDSKPEINDYQILSNNSGIPQSDKNQINTLNNTSINNYEKTLLIDVYQYPLSGVVERYRRLNWSRRRGNHIKLSCINKGLLHPVTIPTRTGIVVLLELTSNGRAYLRNQGHNVPSPSPRHGGIEHEYWKQKIAQYYRDKGFKVATEAPIGKGNTVDILIEKDKQKTAIEIETGKGNCKSNLSKYLKCGISTILLLGTDQDALAKIKKSITGEDEFINKKIFFGCCIEYY